MAGYCDPPYFDKYGRYEHDFQVYDHDRLAAALNRFRRTRWLVSYYDHPALVELYPPDRWTHRRLKANKQLTNSASHDETQAAPEVLIIGNGGSLVEPRGMLF